MISVVGSHATLYPRRFNVTLPGPFNAGTFAPAVLWLVPDVSVPDGEALPAPPQPARHVSRSAAVSRIDNAFFILLPPVLIDSTISYRCIPEWIQKGYPLTEPIVMPCTINRATKG